MNFPAFSVPRHNAHYEGAYDEREVRWRQICAKDKARNIIDILGARAAHVATVLEVGCGTGAVLLDVARAGLGKNWAGVDMADPGNHPDPNVQDSALVLSEYDGMTLPWANASVDLTYASHVLEHVPDVRGFLRELSRVSAKYVYIEVPCELNLFATVTKLQRTLDIGHINAYTPESLSLTLATAGLEVLDLRVFDHSVAVHAFSVSKPVAWVKRAIRGWAMTASPHFATRLFTYHCGALCKKADKQ